ncbi:hypothetical protein [Aliivibrio sp. EL58]|uniref:hypothetical protein n=1 Tax=Aliivibrio sp. EL58 TaxID=2107582 RepID=UPI000EFB60CB|nr:hypothetical protein [Aliivibrio sp. EL58]
MNQFKSNFLKKVKTNDKDRASKNSVRAALSRCKTYSSDNPRDRKKFRDDFREMVVNLSKEYSTSVSQSKHEINIVNISNVLSQKHGHILVNGRLRIGQAQKALNLYLKYLWCLGRLEITPPNCPVDSIVLNGANLKGCLWTHLDCIETYNSWCLSISKHAKVNGFASAQEWELQTWNANA